MATWQDRADEWFAVALRPLMEGLAEGGIVDEGERPTDWEGLHPVMKRFAEDRPARAEWEADARLWLIENPAHSVPAEFGAGLRAAVRAARATDDYVALQRIAADFQNPEWVPRAKNPADDPEYVAGGDARALKAGDFYAEVVAGGAALVRSGWSPHEYPEREYMKQKAASDVDWSRSERADPGNTKSMKQIKYERALAKFEGRYYRALKKRSAQQRGLTPPLPT